VAVRFSDIPSGIPWRDSSVYSGRTRLCPLANLNAGGMGMISRTIPALCQTYKSKILPRRQHLIARHSRHVRLITPPSLKFFFPGLLQDNRISRSGIREGERVFSSGGFPTGASRVFPTSRTGWMATNIKYISNQVVEAQRLELHEAITTTSLPEFQKFSYFPASLPASYRFSYCVPSGSPILVRGLTSPLTRSLGSGFLQELCCQI
jgi:hypothetical protein